MSNCAGSEPYALQVLGDSMEPEFPDGCIIIIEPDGSLSDGCFVIANKVNDIVLRQLCKRQDEWFLVPLNASYNDEKIDNIDVIRGRVIQRAGRKRSDRKCYL